MTKLITWIAEHRELLVRYAKRYVSCQEAEDVYGELCAAVLTYAPDKELEEPEKYVYSTFNRVIYKYKSGLVQEIDIDGNIDLVFSQLHDNLDGCSSPLEGLLLAESREKLVKEISVIGNPTHRKLLELIVLEDVSTITASEMVGLTAVNGRVILYRFCKMLTGE